MWHLGSTWVFLIPVPVTPPLLSLSSRIVPFDCGSLGKVAEYTECAVYTVSTQQTLGELMNLEEPVKYLEAPSQLGRSDLLGCQPDDPPLTDPGLRLNINIDGVRQASWPVTGIGTVPGVQPRREGRGSARRQHMRAVAEKGSHFPKC